MIKKRQTAEEWLEDKKLAITNRGQLYPSTKGWVFSEDDIEDALAMARAEEREKLQKGPPRYSVEEWEYLRGFCKSHNIRWYADWVKANPDKVREILENGAKKP